MLALRSGAAKVLLRGEDGMEIVLTLREPPEIIGEQAALTGRTRPPSARARQRGRHAPRQRVAAKKAARLAEAVVNARLDQILAWNDPAHRNFAKLGESARMARQTVRKRDDAIKKTKGTYPKKAYVITCPHCGSTNVEEYGHAITGTR
ncbi:hypothetical protein P3T39_006401 [Kitasatospora sp. GP82]|nr:hypothetical protein [Kitasatospora sp. GP82]